MRSSTNPLAYCEGGFYGGRLGIHDKIKPLLKSATASFGITALNELQELHNGKSLVEDGQFAIDTLQHINDKIAEFKKADGNLYAIYGTPAESLCGLQVTQFRKKYGVVEHVSDRPYVSNSFHCHVTEDISPIQKQDLEKRSLKMTALWLLICSFLTKWKRKSCGKFTVSKKPRYLPMNTKRNFKSF